MKAKFLALFISSAILASPVYAAVKADHSLKAGSQTAQSQQQKINLNTADLTTLTGSFKGIGKKRAEAIIAWREANHGFKSVEDLSQVKGFGDRFVQFNLQALQERFTI